MRHYWNYKQTQNSHYHVILHHHLGVNNNNLEAVMGMKQEMGEMGSEVMVRAIRWKCVASTGAGGDE